MGKFEVLVFDLGGVLADFRGLERLKNLLSQNMSLEDMRKRWLLSSSVKKFETGQCNTTEFASDFIKEWKLEMNPSQFIEEFSTWVNGPYDGALALLESVKTDYTLVCLTNCNEIHWDIIKDTRWFVNAFHHMYSSHEIGVAKPDKAAFEHVLTHLDANPKKIAFFDDSKMNVEVAKSLGINSYKVFGLTELEKKLKELAIT